MVDPEVDVEEYLSELAKKYAADMGDYPEPPHKDTQLSFMRDVVSEEDSVRQAKTSNLKDEEAGKPRVSVLSFFDIAQFADSEGYDLVAGYLRQRALSVGAVSLGRRAKLIDSLFTVRREHKALGAPKETKRRGLFGSTTVREGYEE